MEIHFCFIMQEAGELINKDGKVSLGCYSRKQVNGSSHHDITLTSETRHQLLDHFNNTFSQREFHGKLSHVRIQYNSSFHLCTLNIPTVLWKT